MNKLKNKTSAVLDACLSNESPEVRAKVYEIINQSGLEADDPMFLILALTGQMRVFLETAPTELAKLLADWKQRSADSLEEITAAIARVKDTQLQQAQTFATNIEQVGNQCVTDIKEAGMAATSAIAEANSETLANAKQACNETRDLKLEISKLHAGVEKNRQQNEAVSQAFLGKTSETIGGLENAIVRIHNLGTAIQKLQKNTIRMKVTDWLIPFLGLCMTLSIGSTMGWTIAFKKYHVPNSAFAQQIIDWNLDRFLKCERDGNPKCTIFIVPPPQRK